MQGAELVTVVVVAAVVIIGFVAHWAGKLGIAAPLLLVVVGIALGLIPGIPDIVAPPDVILTVILPPLLYAAALHVPFVDFRRNLRVIAFLSVVLVVVSALVVGLVVHAVWPVVSLAIAIALGAVVAPPDAVAAISLGKRLGLPPRIVTILEGEGLVNDATALVLLSTALGIAAGDAEGGGWGVLGTFVWAVAGAVVLGWLIGRATVWLRSRNVDGVLDTAVSLVVPFVAFLAAETVHASGVVAVVVAGIVVGNDGIFEIRASHRIAERGNWQTFSMLVENGVFLLMGFLLPPVIGTVAASDTSLGGVIAVGLLVTVVLVVLRCALMPVLLWWMRRHATALERRQRHMGTRMARADEHFEGVDDERIASRLDRYRAAIDRQQHDVTAERDQSLGWRDGVVVGLSGMRGVVTIAAVQTLPHDHPYYAPLVLVAFIVAVVSLLGQGFALPPVIRALRLRSDADDAEREQFLGLSRRLRDVGAQAIEAEIAARGDVPPVVAEELRGWVDERMRRIERYAAGDRSEAAEVEQYKGIRRAEMEAQRAALRDERRRGEFSSEAIGHVQRLLDQHEVQLESQSRDD